MISNEFYEKKVQSETKKTLVSSTNVPTDYDSNTAEDNFDDLTGILIFKTSHFIPFFLSIQ
jgi:hypothetical protein